ncbi:MAG: hypothetical protein ACLP9L_08070 [Thermoguttaceae bacterium]
MSDPNQPTQPNENPVSAEDASEGKRRAADRLNIPSVVVRASGFLPGDTVYVTDENLASEVSGPALMLLKAQPAKLLGQYVVSKDCRIRVTPAMLKKAGFEGETFEFDSGSGKIVVRSRKPATTS